MTFRSDLDALDARHAVLATELSAKTRELEDATRLLEEARARAKLPVLANIRIASPCRADWNEMLGDERARHCNTCDKQVFNLSSMTRLEAEALIVERAGELCARYYARPDGTIILADCSIAAGAARRRKLVAAAALVLLGTGAAAVKHHHAQIHADALEDVGVEAPREAPRGHFANGVHADAPPPRPRVAPEIEPKPEPEPIKMGTLAFHLASPPDPLGEY